MKQLLTSTLLLSSFTVAGTASAASTATAVWNTNQHTYTIVTNDSPVTWHEAKAAAELAGGHLATLTSQAELDFVYENLASDSVYWEINNDRFIGPWLGATDEETEGEWKWVTGEAWEFTNWANSDQPDNFLERLE